MNKLIRLMVSLIATLVNEVGQPASQSLVSIHVPSFQFMNFPRHFLFYFYRKGFDGYN